MDAETTSFLTALGDKIDRKIDTTASETRASIGRVHDKINATREETLTAFGNLEVTQEGIRRDLESHRNETDRRFDNGDEDRKEMAGDVEELQASMGEANVERATLRERATPGILGGGGAAAAIVALLEWFKGGGHS